MPSNFVTRLGTCMYDTRDAGTPWGIVFANVSDDDVCVASREAPRTGCERAGMASADEHTAVGAAGSVRQESDRDVLQA